MYIHTHTHQPARRLVRCRAVPRRRFVFVCIHFINKYFLDYVSHRGGPQGPQINWGAPGVPKYMKNINFLMNFWDPGAPKCIFGVPGPQKMNLFIKYFFCISVCLPVVL